LRRRNPLRLLLLVKLRLRNQLHDHADLMSLSGSNRSSLQVRPRCIGIDRGEPKGPFPPNFLENIVILCFERRFSEQNSVIRLKSSILDSPRIFWPPPNFWAGYATAPMPNSVIRFCEILQQLRPSPWLNRYPRCLASAQ